ncbi:MAG: hypothetical protein WC860_00850 [Candidatus Margulisiibacteriota bacterium]|jgi:hypothetical protein
MSDISQIGTSSLKKADAKRLEEIKNSISSSDLPEEIKDQIVDLLSLISDGIQPDELKELKGLLGKLLDILIKFFPNILAEIKKELKELINELMKKEVASKIDDKFLQYIQDKVDKIIERFTEENLNNMADLLSAADKLT